MPRGTSNLASRNRLRRRRVEGDGHRAEGGQGQDQQAPALTVAAPLGQGAPKRDKQLNIKVSAECKLLFAWIAEAQGLSAAAMFEDMVAERAELLTQAGLLDG